MAATNLDIEDHLAAVSETDSLSFPLNETDGPIKPKIYSHDEIDMDFLEIQARLCFYNKSESHGHDHETEAHFESGYNSTTSTGLSTRASNSSSEGLFCPRTFDGWSCWPQTPAGQTAFQPCPYFITGFDPNREGHKSCLEDGTWFRHPDTNVTWSNYTTCVDLNDLAWRQNVIIIQVVGYLISLCALITSLVIFCSFHSLQCTRVRLHKHLFLSFIINNILWLIWYWVISIPQVTTNPDNTIYCASLHVLVQYFLLSNYLWMFSEGFYLHALIVFTFLARYESKLLLGFYITGWLGPAIPVFLYTLFRGLDEDFHETSECWVHPSKWTYFLSVPVCVSLILSLLFLINILRVLVLKLSDNRRHSLGRESRRHQHPQSVENQNAIKKAARATLILIPLLGLHYLLTPLRPENWTEGEQVYEYVTAVSLSIQGLCVSLLFCFFNTEVISALKRRFCPQQMRLKRVWNENSTTCTRNSTFSRKNTTISTIRPSSSGENEPAELGNNPLNENGLKQVGLVGQEQERGRGAAGVGTKAYRLGHSHSASTAGSINGDVTDMI